MFEFLSTDVLTTLFEIVLINLMLSGDNAIVIGLAAAGLPQAQQGKAILIGIVAATMLRILFAGLATQILQVVGLLFAGSQQQTLVNPITDVLTELVKELGTAASLVVTP